MAVAIEKTKRPPRVDQELARLASLTCGVYLFHGIIMATGVNGSAWLSREHAPVLRLLLFAITMVESFLAAWAFAWFIQAIPSHHTNTPTRMRPSDSITRLAMGKEFLLNPASRLLDRSRRSPGRRVSRHPNLVLTPPKSRRPRHVQRKKA
jgi:hypothetical protein